MVLVELAIWMWLLPSLFEDKLLEYLLTNLNFWVFMYLLVEALNNLTSILAFVEVFIPAFGIFLTDLLVFWKETVCQSSPLLVLMELWVSCIWLDLSSDFSVWCSDFNIVEHWPIVWPNEPQFSHSILSPSYSITYCLCSSISINFGYWLVHWQLYTKPSISPSQGGGSTSINF